MQYVFIIAVILLVLTVLLLITNKRAISFNKDWINLVKEKTVKADRNYIFQKDGEMIIDNKKKLNFIKAISNNMAVYSHSDYINKFMLIFSNYSSVKVTFMEGYIADKAKGRGGFGYDPIFYVEEFKKNVAELSDDEKNSISHRGKALRLMRDKIMEGIR